MILYLHEILLIHELVLPIHRILLNLHELIHLLIINVSQTNHGDVNHIKILKYTIIFN